MDLIGYVKPDAVEMPSVKQAFGERRPNSNWRSSENYNAQFRDLLVAFYPVEAKMKTKTR